VSELFSAIQAFMDAPFLPIGRGRVSIWGLIYTAVLLTILVVVTNRTRKWFEKVVLSRAITDAGVRNVLASIAAYMIIFVGSLIILQTAGVDISSLTVLAGSLGLGLSLGLQNITTNIVAGLILLIEKPVKVGDHIEIDMVQGEVVKISLRATTVLTPDNLSVIIPNSEFVKGKVTNWNMNGSNVRVHVPIPVPRGEDLERVKAIMLKAAQAHSGVLAEPAADVIFESFGDKTVTLALRVYTSEYLNKPVTLKSDLSLALCSAFKEARVDFLPAGEV
jgi:small-conductance mechanosensitive channel